MRRITLLAAGLLTAVLAAGSPAIPVTAVEPQAVGSNPQAPLRVNTPSQTAAQSILLATWAGCGWKDNTYKMVRVFSRYRATAKTGEYLRGGKSDLHCGSANWGYRHILAGHRFEWEQMARLAQDNWRDTADYSIKWALRDPDRVTYRRAKETFCFQRSILLVNERNGQVVGRRDVAVVVARESKNIITALPGPCRGSDS